jgi:hypothetical protein
MPVFVGNTKPTNPENADGGVNSKPDNDVIEITPGAIQEPDFCTCIQQCIPPLTVFTDEIGTDYYKNDISSIFMRSIEPGSGFALFYTFTKTITNIDTGVVTTLTDTTHGTYYKLNFAKWFIVDWYKIQQTLGYGKYQLEMKEVNTLSNDVITVVKSPVYHLKKYSDRRANRTVRLEISQAGKIENGNDYRNLISFNNYPSSTPRVGPFIDQIRLPGTLKFTGSSTENSRLILDNGVRSSYVLKDQERPQYELNIQLVSSEQIMLALFDGLFSNPLSVTDYNVFNHVIDPRNKNAKQYRSIPLLKEGMAVTGGSPRRKRWSYSFEMSYAYDNVFNTTI